jgi:serine/threonine-protein kinase
MKKHLYPELLEPGDTVGPWRILEVLGTSNNCQLFKVKRKDHCYLLKMSLRPVSSNPPSDEEPLPRPMAHEMAARFIYSNSPHLPRVHTADVWPEPHEGYPYLITDFVEGDTWLDWCWKVRPDASRLAEAFCGVVRLVDALHSEGVHLRDLKPDTLLLHRDDDRALLMDLSYVSLPWVSTQALGLPDGPLHLQPPELIDYIRRELWKQGEPFEGGEAADLYALGLMLYQGLTDHHPFNPRLPDKALVAAIATVQPKPPHELNPLAPPSLSAIALRLLEKNPEDRYPHARALLKALWEASKERTSPAWKVSLFPPEYERTPPPAETDALPEEALHTSVQATPSDEQPPTPEEAPAPEEAPPFPPAVGSRSRRWARGWTVGLVCLVLTGFAAWHARSTLPPSPPPKGPPPVPSSSTESTPRSAPVLTAWLCATFTLGCPAAQVKPPGRMACPRPAVEAMVKDLNLIAPHVSMTALVDVNQPGAGYDVGLYRQGPLVSRIAYSRNGRLPLGTLLYGYLWTTPGLVNQFGKEAVTVRYHEALLPDGRKYPVCMVLGSEFDARVEKLPGSTAEVVRLPREYTVTTAMGYR